jgi:holo-[acyl-carrier protein] synthase
MTIAIGTDIVEMERIAQSLSRQGDRLVKRVLMPSEQVRYQEIENSEIKTAFLAKRWCAKEAIAKALGTGIAKGVGFQQIEISNDEFGAPFVTLHEGALSRLHTLGATKALVSLSDEQHYAVAFCTLV